MPDNNSARIAEIFVDESSQTQHRYLLLGGIIVLGGPDAAKEIRNLLSEKKAELRVDSELAWTKVSRNKALAYRTIVDNIFQRNKEIHFHCTVIDTTKVDNQKFNFGSREVGFNKEIYQLLMKFARLYNPRKFLVYLDKRSTQDDPRELLTILNNGWQKHVRSNNIETTEKLPFRRLTFRKSHDEVFIQICDLFLGAIAYQLNGHSSQPNASPAKKCISQYVLSRAGITNVFKDTPISGSFTIWHRRLRS